MEIISEFEKQLADITTYYNRIKELREGQKDDGMMIRIFLNEIIPKYESLRNNVQENDVLPLNVKERLLKIIDWEMSRAPLRDAEIERYEDEHHAAYTLEYEGELAHNDKLELPFSIMAEFYTKIKDLRARQIDDGLFGRMELSVLLNQYASMKQELANDTVLPDGIKAELLGIVEEEIRQAPIREEEIEKAERAYAAEYAQAYNAAVARYESLSPLLKVKYAELFKGIKEEYGFVPIERLNKLFIVDKDVKKNEVPTAPGEDGEH